jgi:hypothetical protein
MRVRLVLAAVVALAAGGCARQAEVVVTQVVLPQVTEALLEDARRETRRAYLEQLGPAVLAGAIGVSAPPGGMGGLPAVGLDLAWQGEAVRRGAVPGATPLVLEVAGPGSQ